MIILDVIPDLIRDPGFKKRPQIDPLPRIPRSRGLPGAKRPFVIMESEKILWRNIILKLPELSAILGVIYIYLLKMPKILETIKETDLIRFLMVVVLVSAVALIPCALLLIPHSARIAQEELNKSREILERLEEALRRREKT